MARGINKAILVGNLGNDPDIRYTSGGAAVANISVATAESWKDKNTGEQKEKIEWHRVSAFGRLAEIMGEYLRKGSQVYIEGRIQTRKWQDKEGQDRYTTEIVANEMQMLDGKNNQDASTGADAQRNNESRTSTSRGESDNSAPGVGSADGFSDDVPFMRLTNEYCY